MRIDPKHQNGEDIFPKNIGFSQIEEQNEDIGLSDLRKPTFFQKVRLILSPKRPKSRVKSLLEQIKDFEDEERKKRIEIPNYIEFVYGQDPLEGKDQDFLEYFTLNDGSFGLVVCDGISGEGKQSKLFAREFAIRFSAYFNNNYRNKHTPLSYYQYTKKVIEQAQKDISMEAGGTTMIFALVPASIDQLYLSWMGDGNILYFNKENTGFAKLIHPHRDNTKRLLSAISSNGVIGELATQIHIINGGTLIIATDGYELTNGKVLNHFFKKIITSNNLEESLQQWMKSQCCDHPDQLKVYHPKKHDDRTIAVLRIKSKEV